MSKLDNIKKNLKGEVTEFFQDYYKFLKKYQSLEITEELDSITPISIDLANTPKLAKLSKEMLSSSTQTVPRENNNQSSIYKDIERFIKYFKRQQIERVEYGLIYRIVLTVKHETNYSKEENSNSGDEENSNSGGIDSYLQLVKEELLKFIDDCESEGTIQKYEKYIICFYKVVEHTILANIQYEELYSNSEKQVEMLNEMYEYTSDRVDELFNDVDEEISNINSESGQLTNKIRKLEKRVTNFNTEIISILGVFSAFVFVMFGGFDSLAKILEGLQHNDVSIRKILLISSVLISFLITILYSLMYWVSVIIEKPIIQKSCDCKNVCWNLGHIYTRHRFYLTLMIICAIVFVFFFCFY